MLQTASKQSFASRLFEGRLEVLARAVGFGKRIAPKEPVRASISITGYACFQFYRVISRVLQELESFHGRADTDLELLNLFTHVQQLDSSFGNEAMRALTDVFKLGSLTQLLREPDRWLPYVKLYMESQSRLDAATDAHFADVKATLHNLMANNRRCFMGRVSCAGNAPKLIVVFHLDIELRQDYVHYLEAAFKFDAITESCTDILPR